MSLAQHYFRTDLFWGPVGRIVFINSLSFSLKIYKIRLVKMIQNLGRDSIRKNSNYKAKISYHLAVSIQRFDDFNTPESAQQNTAVNGCFSTTSCCQIWGMILSWNSVIIVIFYFLMRYFSRISLDTVNKCANML